MRVFATILLLLGGISHGLAQSPAVKEFKLNRIDNTVIVEWTIFSGFQCSDVEVQHSLDSSNFNIVHIEFGICGSDTTDEKYAFFHRNPAVQELEYYRIKVGFDEFSEIRALKNENLKPFSLYPNPSLDLVNFSFFNPNLRVFDIRIYSSQGKLVLEQLDVKALENNPVELHTLQKGVYSFTIWQNGEIKHQQKLLKVGQ